MPLPWQLDHFFSSCEKNPWFSPLSPHQTCQHVKIARGNCLSSDKSRASLFREGGSAELQFSSWADGLQHCRSPSRSTVTRTAVVNGKRRLCLRLFFPQKKVSTPSVLAVLVLCLRLLAFVTVSWPPRVYRIQIACIRIQIWLTRYCMCVVYSGDSQRHWKLQLMFSSPSFYYQTWRKA